MTNLKSTRSMLLIPAALLICLIGATVGALAQTPDKPFVAPVFTDNMVLQRNVAIPFWGWTMPQQKVTVALHGKSASAVADADGKWLVKLGPFAAGGPFTVTVTGPQVATLQNVLIGDVWICSGQSNMEFGIGLGNDAQAEIAKADHPQIRLLLVQHDMGATPQTQISGTWKVCSPATVADGGWSGFSAVGYYFGRKLQQDENVPIGLIGTYWGGTVAQAWTSAEALETMPDFRQAVADFESTYRPVPGAKSAAQLTAEWQARNDLNSPGMKATIDPSYDISTWKTMAVPAYWDATNLGQMVGSVWFRKDIDVPASWVGKPAELHVAKVDDADDTFVNGVRVGGFEGYNTLRVYAVGADLLHAGKNVILVRVINKQGPGGIWGDAADMRLDVPGDATIAPISLAGDWTYGPADPMPATLDPNEVTTLYNGMIAPLIPYGIKGAIWYQGESNAGAADQYRVLLPTMIQDWRSRFGVGQFPFLIVQIANFMGTHPQPADTDWARLREAQAITAESLPNTGLAVTIDVGDPKDIHPKDKQDVGYRLALAAEAMAYGAKAEYSGPVFRSATVEGKAMRLTFDHVGDGLMAKGDKLTGFAVAGADGNFVWANASIDGNTVVVSSPQVDVPVAARYAWDDNPVCDLYNKNGLPAVPFRTNAPKPPKIAL